MLEKRVAGIRHHHRVTGVAEQLEQVPVGVTAAGGQDYSLGLGGEVMASEIRRHGSAGGREPKGLRSILESVGSAQTSQQCLRKREPHTGRIRLREVGDADSPPDRRRASARPTRFEAKLAGTRDENMRS